jgi:hypothetical protein
MRFIVMCQMSGSGFPEERQSPIKANGHTVYFDTKEAAEAQVAKMLARSSGPNPIASVRCWVEEVDVDVEISAEQAQADLEYLEAQHLRFDRWAAQRPVREIGKARPQWATSWRA